MDTDSITQFRDIDQSSGNILSRWLNRAGSRAA